MSRCGGVEEPYDSVEVIQCAAAIPLVFGKHCLQRGKPGNARVLSHHRIQFSILSRQVACYETGRFHRHKTHIEEYARAMRCRGEPEH